LVLPKNGNNDIRLTINDFRTVISAIVILLSLIANAVQAVSVGHTAPAFSLKNSDHQSRTLASYKGHVVLINFWASWCAPCQQELPELDRLAAQYAKRGLRVVAINVDEDSANGQESLYKLGLNAPRLEVLWDPRSKVVSAFDIQNLPASFILDTHGKIRFIHSGYQFADLSKWRDEINALLK
jgi:cytochrome c biogenesis protein CcmG/thiol:disulfide interchange protein DsbE